MRVLPPAPFLYAILDASLLGERPVGAAIAALAAGGAALIQLRAKDCADRKLLELAQEAVAVARAVGVPLIVNDRPDVACIAGADGVHVGQQDLAPADARRVLPEGIVGLSTHSEPQLAAALREPIDYLAVGPVFETRSKSRPDPVVGLELVRRARAATQVPACPPSSRRVGVVAIGGITRASAREAIAAGADAVAVISDLLRADDLEAAARALVAALGP